MHYRQGVYTLEISLIFVRSTWIFFGQNLLEIYLIFVKELILGIFITKIPINIIEHQKLAIFVQEIL